MNYRHAYHAGNFADVLKHAVLALCLEHLRTKPAPFRVIDTHAGAGRYDLAGMEAGKTLEWADGVGRLIGVDAQPIPDAVAGDLAPYLDIVRAVNPDGRLSLYPGSPEIVRAKLRADDRLVVNELNPRDYEALSAWFIRDPQVKTLALDGWTAVKALTPPPERRGLVLIDPPFEKENDFEKLVIALAEARRRFATGTYLLWYPIKDPATLSAFYRAAAGVPFDKTLRVEIIVRQPVDVSKLNGCGLYIANPPWTLKARLAALLPFLAERMAQGPGAGHRLEEKS